LALPNGWPGIVVGKLTHFAQGRSVFNAFGFDLHKVPGPFVPLIVQTVSAMNVQIAPSWKSKLETEFAKDYFQQLATFVRQEVQTQTIYPPGKLIFNAFEKCGFDQAKVVIIGQDPYHGPGQANGLCFSVNDGVAVPPSLANIFKEIHTDLGKPVPKSGNLERWASQGVLLLNATLTVRAGAAGSHQGKGWEQFTDAVIRLLADEREHLVFMLWGKYAQDKGKHIDRQKHLVLTAKHPSPMAANYGGWFGCKHFSQANNYLEAKGLGAIDW
jgi:uracil-DNA glycosylase